MKEITINKESQERVDRALEYVNSEAREAYTGQRIPNSRDILADALKAGIELSNESGRYEEVSKILMEG